MTVGKRASVTVTILEKGENEGFCLFPHTVCYPFRENPIISLLKQKTLLFIKLKAITDDKMYVNKKKALLCKGK